MPIVRDAHKLLLGSSFYYTQCIYRNIDNLGLVFKFEANPQIQG